MSTVHIIKHFIMYFEPSSLPNLKRLSSSAPPIYYTDENK